MYKRARPSRLESTKKILIVDADEFTRDLMSKILSSYLGCEVNTCAGESEALSYIKASEFDIIIIGMFGPDLSTVKLVANIQALKPDICLIIVSGNGTDGELENLKSMGINKIIYKPLRISPLLELVASTFLEKEQVLNYA